MVQETKESTAIVALEKDARSYGEVLRLQEAVMRCRDIAIDRSVTTLIDAKDANNDLIVMGNFKKELEVLRQGYVRPRQGEIKDINDFFKLISDPLAEADKVTRDKVLAFKEEQERKRLAAELAAKLQREADEAARQVREDTGEVVEGQKEEPVEVPTTTPMVRSEMGKSGVVKNRTFEIVDEDQIPRSYMTPDLKKIGKVIRAGGEISGVRVIETPTLRVTGRKE